MKKYLFFSLYFFWASVSFAQKSLEDFTLQHYTTKDGLTNNTIYNSCKDISGYLWFATENGLSRFDSKSFKNIDVKNGLKDNMTLGIESYGSFLISYGFKGCDFLRSGKVIPDFLAALSISSKVINSLLIDSLFILTTTDTVYIYKITHLHQNKLVYRSSRFDLHKDKKWSKLFSSKQNTIDKVIHFSDIGRFIRVIQSNETRFCIQLLDNDFNVINEFYTSTNLGVGYSVYKNHLYKTEPNLVSEYSIIKDKIVYTNSISIPLVPMTTFVKMSESEFIINTINDGFYVLTYFKSMSKITKAKFIDRSSWIKANQLTAYTKCHIDFSLDSAIIGTGGGVRFFNLKTKIIDTALLFPKRTYSLFLKNKSTLLIGTIEGLYLYHLTDKSSRKLALPDSNIKINSIDKDKNNNYWISTAGKGIYILDSAMHLIKNLQTKDALKSNDIYKIIIDRTNRAWLSSNQGIEIIEGQNQLSLTESEGLSSNEIEDFFVEGDTAWIYTNKGINRFIYHLDTKVNFIPIYFNSFKINNQELDSLPLTLQADQDKVEFSYIGIYSAAPEQIKYRYRLSKNGEISEWQNTDQTNLIFEKLSSGSYVLELYAYHANNSSIRSQLISRSFQIEKHYYNTWWFYILSTCMILGVILYIVYIRNRRTVENLTHNQELSHLKLEALKAEMNPHFIFNALNGIKEYMMQNDYDNSQYYLSQLAKLIRNALQNSKQEMHSLEDEIAFNSLYIELEQMRFSFKFDFIKDISKLQSPHFEIPSMLLQPFFENAIRHGKIGQLEYQGKLYFAITESKDEIILEIKDNGIGITKSKELHEKMNHGHKSLAMDIINERIDLYRKTQRIDIHIKINELKDDEYRTQILLIIKK